MLEASLEPSQVKQRASALALDSTPAVTSQMTLVLELHRGAPNATGVDPLSWRDEHDHTSHVTTLHAAGTPWLASGPVAHFHSEQRRAAVAMGEARTKGTVAPGDTSLGQLLEAAAFPVPQSSLDFAVGWGIPSEADQPARLGINHLLSCAFKVIHHSPV